MVNERELNFSNKGGVLNVNLSYVKSVSDVKLNKNDSCLVLGKSKDLKLIDYSHLKSVLTDLEVTETWFRESMAFICPNKEKKQADKPESAEAKDPSGNHINWLNKFIIHSISNKCSRTNAPSRPNLVAKAVRQNTYGENQLIFVACEKQNSVATACAIARSFPLYSSKTGAENNEKKRGRNVTVVFLYTDEIGDLTKWHASNEDLKCFKVLAESTRLSAKIVDLPCSAMNTDHFLDEIKVVGKALGIEPFVIEGEELNKQGFGGLYNVGKGALNSPKLVVLTHLSPKARRTIAWVGKGIVFDTGGLCIKSRPSMCGMKEDCGGAAGVLGAFYAAVQLGFNDNLHAVFCLAENAVGPNSYRPDDIITLYSGKTVEITNTDAEGRVVLGDGVAYASKNLKADVIIDMATLTSAQGASTGKYHAAFLTNNETWESVGVETSKKCGELLYPIIFAPELHFSEFDSELADMTNSVANRSNATSSCAGLFIYSHLPSKFDGIWLHIDMASPIKDGDRSTGYGVSILNSLCADSSHNELLRSLGPKQEMPLKHNIESDE